MNAIDDFRMILFNYLGIIKILIRWILIFIIIILFIPHQDFFVTNKFLNLGSIIIIINYYIIIDGINIVYINI